MLVPPLLNPSKLPGPQPKYNNFLSLVAVAPVVEGSNPPLSIILSISVDDICTFDAL